MTVPEAIELFKSEMTNEIFHSSADSSLQNSLLMSIDDVANTVTKTYEAEKKQK